MTVVINEECSLSTNPFPCVQRETMKPYALYDILTISLLEDSLVHSYRLIESKESHKTL